MIETSKLFTTGNVSAELQRIAEKVFAEERITDDEGLLLFEEGSLPFESTTACSWINDHESKGDAKRTGKEVI